MGINTLFDLCFFSLVLHFVDVFHFLKLIMRMSSTSIRKMELKINISLTTKISPLLYEILNPYLMIYLIEFS